MHQTMLSLDQLTEKINRGANLLIAGEEALLRQLPAGNWIAGTIPYFMTGEGVVCNRDQLCVTVLPEYVQAVEIRCYDETSLQTVYLDAPDNGLSFMIIPAQSAAHYSFALNAPNYEHFAVRPLAGWISGVHLDELATGTAQVFNGWQAAASDTAAVVMHVSLPPDKIADIGIVNIFNQADGDAIVFLADGFSARHAMINGEEKKFRDYLIEQQLDTRLPLVANYCGVSINTSIRELDSRQQEVEFYAPVFSGLTYKHARPVADYAGRLKSRLPVGLEHQIVFSCSCILNDRNPDLKGKHMTGMTGPATFGEIAYLLLNQTMVYVRIIDLPVQS